MATSASGPPADTLSVARPAAERLSEAFRVRDSEAKRHSVPIKRNQRLYLELPVRVYAASSGDGLEPLLELTRSLIVYPSGGVLALGASVELGQELLLVNPQNNLKAACRVAGFEASKDGSQPTVRLEFTQRLPKFWGVGFPPEKTDPAERKLPRLPRRARRVESSQPIQVCQAEEAASDVKDVCITQNISRDGLYFTSGQSSYSEGMRVTITFLNRSELFAAEAGYAAQIVRIEGIADGRVGVAVRLLGNKVKPSSAPIAAGSGAAIASAENANVAAGASSLAKLRMSAAKHVNGFVRWGASLAELCKKPDSSRSCPAAKTPDVPLEKPENASS
jgi:hypothetical protein